MANANPRNYSVTKNKVHIMRFANLCIRLKAYEINLTGD